MEIKICKRNNLCVDCDNKKCLHAGDIMADCPKYRCDAPNHDCENCEFIKQYQKDFRKE